MSHDQVIVEEAPDNDDPQRYESLKRADRLIEQGLSRFKSKNYEIAANLFSKALSLKTRFLNVRDESLGDLYYYYGRSILVKIQETGDVFGDKANRTINEKEKQFLESQNEPTDASASTVGESTQTTNTTDQNKEIDDVMEESHFTDDEDLEDDYEDEGEEEEGDEIEEEKEGTTQVEEPIEIITTPKTYQPPPQPSVEQNQPADPTAELEVAWDVLELARVIFNKEGEKKKARIADVHETLGEVALEADNFPGAIEEFNKCLHIRESISPPDYRSIAGTHFLLALAYELNVPPPSAPDAADLRAKSTVQALDHLELAKSYLMKEHARIAGDADQQAELLKMIKEIDEKIEAVKTVPEEPPEAQNVANPALGASPFPPDFKFTFSPQPDSAQPASAAATTAPPPSDVKFTYTPPPGVVPTDVSQLTQAAPAKVTVLQPRKKIVPTPVPDSGPIPTLVPGSGTVQTPVPDTSSVQSSSAQPAASSTPATGGNA